MTEITYTKIGCEIFLRKGNSILMGKRKNCYGAGMWGLPGGHLEFNERLVDAVCREVKEELGAAITSNDVKLVSIVDDLQPDKNTHYVHVSFELREPSFEPAIMEPDRCEEWKYFPLDALPDNIFPPHTGIIENYLSQRFYLY